MHESRLVAATTLRVTYGLTADGPDDLALRMIARCADNVRAITSVGVQYVESFHICEGIHYIVTTADITRP